MINDDNPQIKVKSVDYIDRQTDNSIVCFIRNYVYDECGDFQSIFDIDLDGNPYTITGVLEKADSGNITNNILDVTALETITQIVDNNDGTFTYTNEANVPVTITAGNSSTITNTIVGHLIATHNDGGGNITNIEETVTSLGVSSNVLTYTKEDGTTDTVDLSIYLDDSNLARLTSGSVDAAGLATFTRDDSTTFTVDFSGLFDDTNLARIVSGAIVGSDIVLTRDDSTTLNIDVSALNNETNTLIQNTITGNKIADYTNETNTTTDIFESITTLLDNGDGTATYTNESGSPSTITLGAIKEYWHGVGGAGQTLNNNTITTTNINQDLNSNASVFSLAGNVLTVSKTSDYVITYSGTSDTADGGRRAMVFDIYINGVKQNAEGYTYSRNNASGENTASNRKIVSLTTGDTIEIRMLRNSAGSVQTVPNGISLTVEEK